MYIDVQQIRANRSTYNRAYKCIRKNRKLHKFATINRNFKSRLLDIHHRKTYMYINFQQNRVSRSVKTVHTNLFAKICKLHQFATCN